MRTSPGGLHAEAAPGSSARLEPGVFLVASREIGDPHFRHTVILITAHNRTGSTGLVINRPLDMLAEEILPQIGKLTSDSGRVQVGGPVTPGAMQVLLQLPHGLEHWFPVFENLYLVTNPAQFEELVEEGIRGDSARIYIGFSGWAPGQLELEMRRGDWHLWPADSRSVFTQSHDSIWPELIELVGARMARRL